MKRAHRNHSHRGVATLLAVVALGLVAAALTSMALLIRNDIRRTQSVQIDAQLRQLLLAGVCDAVSRSRDWTDAIEPGKWSVALPNDQALESASLSGDLQSDAPASSQVRVRAVIADRSAEERLQFQRFSGGWKLIRVGPPSASSPDRQNR